MCNATKWKNGRGKTIRIGQRALTKLYFSSWWRLRVFNASCPQKFGSTAFYPIFAGGISKDATAFKLDPFTFSFPFQSSTATFYNWNKIIMQITDSSIKITNIIEMFFLILL